MGISCLCWKGWLFYGGFFCFVLFFHAVEKEYNSLKSFCPFDKTVFLILKNKIKVFHVSLAQWRQWILPYLVMFMEKKPPCICVSMLINLQMKVSVISESLEFGEQGDRRQQLGKIRTISYLEWTIRWFIKPPYLYTQKSHKETFIKLLA